VSTINHSLAVDPASYRRGLTRLFSNPTMAFGVAVLAILTLTAALAPFLSTADPTFIIPRLRLRSPTSEHWLGTDSYGRDLYSRVVYGGRISLIVGAVVPLLACGLGVLTGLFAGYVALLDKILMRIMDGLMAIPAVLLAIACVALWGASLTTVAVAITVPEVPRVARLVRGLVLTLREEPYVEAAVGVGTPTWLILWRHLLPHTVAPLIVQATYIAASAILTEAVLSFLGAGIPTETPSWGNIMAEGRLYFQTAPWIILFPGFCLAVTVLGVNLLGDGLRDTLDPRIAESTGKLRP
jgi:peptide/nickel transport system permease protein